MSFPQGTRSRRGGARAVAACLLAFLLAAPCCFVPAAVAAPAFGAENQPCHDAQGAANGVACAHVASPAAVGATDLPVAFVPSQHPVAAVPAFSFTSAAQPALAGPRRPPPLEARPVPLYLLHLSLLN